MQRTLGPDGKIKRLENGGASEDGLKVMFDIITTDGRSHSFWMADNDLENFLAYVIGLSQYAAGASGKIHAPKGPETRTVQPIEGVGVSIMPGRAKNEGLLAIHLGTFPLTFALSANVLQQLHGRLGEMLHPTEAQKPH